MILSVAAYRTRNRPLPAVGGRGGDDGADGGSAVPSLSGPDIGGLPALDALGQEVLDVGR